MFTAGETEAPRGELTGLTSRHTCRKTRDLSTDLPAPALLHHTPQRMNVSAVLTTCVATKSRRPSEWQAGHSPCCPMR